VSLGALEGPDEGCDDGWLEIDGFIEGWPEG